MARIFIGSGSNDTSSCESSASRPVRVAVVDDDVAILTAVRRVLSKAGYDVATFSSSSEFLGAPRQEPPACVLLDVVMPEPDGLEVQKVLRSTSAVPVVFMTGHDDVQAAVVAMVADGKKLAGAAMEGKLSVRADAGRH
jgi:FixJ family two-component response regulator